MKEYVFTEQQLAEAMYALIAGMSLIAVLCIGVIILCGVTLDKVDAHKKSITELLNNSNENTSNLSVLVKELNENLKIRV